MCNMHKIYWAICEQDCVILCIIYWEYVYNIVFSFMCNIAQYISWYCTQYKKAYWSKSYIILLTILLNIACNFVYNIDVHIVHIAHIARVFINCTYCQYCTVTLLLHIAHKIAQVCNGCAPRWSRGACGLMLLYLGHWHCMPRPAPRRPGQDPRHHYDSTWHHSHASKALKSSNFRWSFTGHESRRSRSRLGARHWTPGLILTGNLKARDKPFKFAGPPAESAWGARISS